MVGNLQWFIKTLSAIKYGKCDWPKSWLRPFNLRGHICYFSANIKYLLGLRHFQPLLDRLTASRFQQGTAYLEYQSSHLGSLPVASQLQLAWLKRTSRNSLLILFGICCWCFITITMKGHCWNQYVLCSQKMDIFKHWNWTIVNIITNYVFSFQIF